MQAANFKKLVFVSALLGPALLGACGDDSGAADAQAIDAQPSLGTFSLSWALTDGSNALTCGQVGAFSVAVTLIPQDGFSGESESFSCSSGEGQSRGLVPGLYNARIDVRASGSRSLLEAPIVIADVEIAANTDKVLPAQEFVISPQGSFSFFVDSGATGGNCAELAANGAGIVGVAFELENESGVCLEADFIVAEGSQAGGTYSSNCTTPPAPLPCIGKDQLVSVSSVPSGARTLTTTAQKAGPVDCYEGLTTFTVAGAGLLTELGEVALQLEYSAACDPNFVEPDAGVDAAL